MNVAMRWKEEQEPGDGKAAGKPLKRLMVVPWSPLTPLKQGVNESEALARERNKHRTSNVECQCPDGMGEGGGLAPGHGRGSVKKARTIAIYRNLSEYFGGWGVAAFLNF